MLVSLVSVVVTVVLIVLVISRSSVVSDSMDGSIVAVEDCGLEFELDIVTVISVGACVDVSISFVEFVARVVESLILDVITDDDSVCHIHPVSK